METFANESGDDPKRKSMKGEEPAKKPERVELRIPASTSNLGPGFDTIGLAVSLYNEFLFEWMESGLEII